MSLSLIVVSREGWTLRLVESVELVIPGGSFSLTAIFQATEMGRWVGNQALAMTYLSSPYKRGRAIVQISTQLSPIAGLDWDLETKNLRAISGWLTNQGQSLGDRLENEGYLDPLDGWARWGASRHLASGQLWELSPKLR